MSTHDDLIARLESDAASLDEADKADRFGVQLVGEDVVRLIGLLREAAAALTAQGETAPAPVDRCATCGSALIGKPPGCAEHGFAPASPLPPGEALEELARETATEIALQPNGRKDYDIILTALRRAVSEGSR